MGAVFSPNWSRQLRGFPADRYRASAARRRTSPPGGSGGSRVSLVGRRAGLRGVSQTGPARSLLQVSRWLSMELALAGRGRVDVGVCSVVGWTRMFGTGGARRMLSRMFGGVDAGLSLGDLSGGALAFQPGHAAKFAQGPRAGAALCCPQAGSRRSGSRSRRISLTEGGKRGAAVRTREAPTRGPTGAEGQAGGAPTTRLPAGHPSAPRHRPRTEDPPRPQADPEERTDRRRPPPRHPPTPHPWVQGQRTHRRNADERTRRQSRHRTPPRRKNKAPTTRQHRPATPTGQEQHRLPHHKRMTRPPPDRTSTPTAPTAPTARPPPTEPTPPTPPRPRPTAPNPPTPQPRPPATKPETDQTLLPLPPPDPSETDFPTLIPPTPHNADRHTRPTDPQPATPAPKQPKQNHKNHTEHLHSEKPTPPNPGGHRRISTRANLGGPHGIRRE